MTWRRAVRSRFPPVRVGPLQLLLGAAGWAVLTAVGVVSLRAALWDYLSPVGGALGLESLTPLTLVLLQFVLAAVTGLVAVTLASTAWRRMERQP